MDTKNLIIGDWYYIISEKIKARYMGFNIVNRGVEYVFWTSYPLKYMRNALCLTYTEVALLIPDMPVDTAKAVRSILE